MYRDQVVQFLADGNLRKAMYVAKSHGDHDLVAKITQSQEFLKDRTKYKAHYNSDFDGDRIPGSFAGKPMDRRQTLLTHHVTRLAQRKWVLDVGCADGTFAFHLLASGINNVTGVDIWEDGIAYARQQGEDRYPGRTTFVAGMFEEIGFVQDFDVIVFAEVLEHVIDVEKVLSKAAKMLSPDGRIVVTVPVSRPPIKPQERDQLLSGEPIQHVRLLDEKSLVKQAWDLDLIPELFNRIGGAWHNVVATFRRAVL